MGHFVVRSINYGFSKRELSITQREGIITFIPKDNKPRHFVKIFRPISLLNCVYKLLLESLQPELRVLYKN